MSIAIHISFKPTRDIEKKREKCRRSSILLLIRQLYIVGFQGFHSISLLGVVRTNNTIGIGLCYYLLSISIKSNNYFIYFHKSFRQRYSSSRLTHYNLIVNHWFILIFIYVLICFAFQDRKRLNENYDAPASGRESWWRKDIRVSPKLM